MRVQKTLNMKLAPDRQHSIINKVDKSISILSLIQDIWDEGEIFLSQKNKSILQSYWISDCDLAVFCIAKVTCNHFPVGMLLRGSFKKLCISCLSFASRNIIFTMTPQIAETIGYQHLFWKFIPGNNKLSLFFI